MSLVPPRILHASRKMKIFPTILFFSLLAGGSLAHRCDNNRKVNLTLLSNTAREAVKELELLTTEHGIDAGKFKDDFFENTMEYGQRLVHSFYEQGKTVSEKLVHDVQKYYSELERCLDSQGHESRGSYGGGGGHGTHGRKCVSEALKELTNQQKEMLALKPGNVVIVYDPLSELPPYPKIKSRTEERPARDVLLNIIQTLEEDCTSIFAYVNQIYLTAWKPMRKVYDVVQKEFRDELLHEYVTNKYQETARAALERKDEIQNRVDRETWDDFEDASHRVIAAWDEYNAAKNNENC